MISADDANLEKFGRHVPRVLGNQIITQLVDQYLSGENSPLIEPDFENTCPPSIERFHGALLFVDISGFTVLSQRLPVDALRLHINAYFKKILDIIFKYGGDVVKFAGDALFIVWQTPVSSLDAPNFAEAARLSVQRAVSCGLEINVNCSNYMINLAPKNKQASQLTSALLEKKVQAQHSTSSTPSAVPKLHHVNSGGSDSTTASLTQQAHARASASSPVNFLVSPPNELADTASESNGDSVSGNTPKATPRPTQANVETDTITYLNVHSGVGVGVMAGIDVGAQNRWEYLLLGQPLSDVAVAESMATKGELVISPEAHALLCGGIGSFASPTKDSNTASNTTNTTNTSTKSSPLPPTQHSPPRRASHSRPRCKCLACDTNTHYYRVDPDIPLVEPVNTETPEELSEYDLYFYSEIMDRTTVAYREIMGQVDEMCHDKIKLPPAVSTPVHSSASTGALPTYNMLSPRTTTSLSASTPSRTSSVVSPRASLDGTVVSVTTPGSGSVNGGSVNGSVGVYSRSEGPSTMNSARSALSPGSGGTNGPGTNGVLSPLSPSSGNGVYGVVGSGISSGVGSMGVADLADRQPLHLLAPIANTNTNFTSPNTTTSSIFNAANIQQDLLALSNVPSIDFTLSASSDVSVSSMREHILPHALPHSVPGALNRLPIDEEHSAHYSLHGSSRTTNPSNTSSNSNTTSASTYNSSIANSVSNVGSTSTTNSFSTNPNTSSHPMQHSHSILLAGSTSTNASFSIDPPTITNYSTTNTPNTNSTTNTNTTNPNTMAGFMPNIPLKCSAEVTELLFGHYLSWVQQCLMCDFAMHVHEADRTDFEFKGQSRKGALEKFASSQPSLPNMHSYMLGMNSANSSMSIQNNTSMQNIPNSTSVANLNSMNSMNMYSNSNISTSNLSQATPPRRGSNARSFAASNASMREGGTSFVAKMRTLNTSRMSLKEQNKSKNRRIRQQDTSLTAELRNVIVLFISVKLDSEALLTTTTTEGSRKEGSEKSDKYSGKYSEKASAHCYVHSGDYVHSRIKGFHFLSRTEEEFNDDQRIMNSFQDCMEIMTKNFKTHGGQMRQFIVDDKGTVCIGTFGLRGSVTTDNAAAAIDAAGAIIFQLHKIGIEASIGITSGKAYCGLVGSPLRHEYAVMGPSTNLSARLMGKAKQGEVMCDGETRTRDRTHTFHKLGEIQAKGYSIPVPTFKPNLTIRNTRTSTVNMHAHGLNRMETNSGKSTTSFFDGNHLANMSSPNLRYVHGSLADLASSSGSNSNILTPMNRNKTRMKRKFTNQMDPQRLPLEGRNEEVDDVFAFLCPLFVSKYGALTKFSVVKNAFNGSSMHLHNSSYNSGVNSVSKYGMTSPPLHTQHTHLSPPQNTPIQQALHFDTTCRTKASIVQGPTGIGKSSFIKLFCEKLRNLYKIDRNVNMFLFHNSSNGNNTQPFNVWKGIVRQLLLSFSQTLPPVHTNTTHNASKAALPRTASVSAAHTSEVEVTNGKAELIRGLDYATSLLPDEYHELKPLLTAIHFVHGYGANDTTSKLGGVSKLLRITEYLSALIQQFTVTTGKILCIAIEDMETMDSASWQLLKHIWEHNTGIVICASHTSNVTTKKGVDLNLFRDLDRIHLVDLKPLTIEATRLIATRIFESNDVKDVQEEVYVKLHTMSGGNALFLYELAKAMLEWYHNTIEEQKDTSNGITSSNNSPTHATVSFSDAIQDFRTTRIEEVICYRFDQFDTAAQLLLKLASVACANSEVFSLRLLSHMIQDDSGSAGGVFACLKSSSVDGSDEDQLNNTNTIYNTTANTPYTHNNTIEEEEVGFEPDSPRQEEWELRTDSVLVHTLSSLLQNNEFIRIVKKQPASIGQSVRAVNLGGLGMSGKSDNSLLDEENEDGEDEDMIGELSPMHSLSISPLKKGSKLQITPVKFVPAFANGNVVTADALTKLFFDFKIRLEQSTIYDLMLDEQKQALHERVATYLETQSLLRPLSAINSTDLYEEGFHWERATGWSSAMNCYYRSAMLHDEVGAFQESFLHLTAAYRMLNAMRNEAGVTEDFQFAAASFQAIFSHGEKDTTNTNTQTLKKSDIIRIFDNDSSLLELGLNVLLRLAQSSFSLSDNPEVTSKLYEDALQLIMLTWNWKDALAMNSNFGASLGLAEGTLDDTVSTANTPISPTHRLKRSKTVTSDVDSVSNTGFGLKDPTIVFPILAGIAALYRNNKLKDDKSRTKESTLYDLSLVLARTSPTYLPHLICAMCLQRTLMFELGRVKESLTMTDGIVSMYDEHQHAAQLVRAYGNNRVPYTIMMHVQLLRVSGYFHKSYNLMHGVLNTLPEMTHLHSVGITVYPAISVMMLDGSQREALRVFQSYIDLERERGGYNFFKESNPLFLEALETAVTYEQFTEQKDLSHYIAHCETHASQLMECKVLDKEFLPADKGSRSMLYDTLSSFGTSVEHCCGLLLLLKARMTCKRIEMRPAERHALVWKYLTTALEYENFHVSVCVEPDPSTVPGAPVATPTTPGSVMSSVVSSVGTSNSGISAAAGVGGGGVKMIPIDRLAFAHFGSLITKACILTMMAHYEAEHTTASATNTRTTLPGPSFDKTDLLTQAAVCLTECEEIGVRQGYHFITLHAGVYFEILGLDNRRGKQLQVQALDAIQAMCGHKEFALAFDDVINAFPILERFKIKYTMLSDNK